MLTCSMHCIWISLQHLNRWSRNVVQMHDGISYKWHLWLSQTAVCVRSEQHSFIHLSILTENPVKYNIPWQIVPLKEMEMIFKKCWVYSKLTQFKQSVTLKNTDSGKGREGSVNWHATMTSKQTRIWATVHLDISV